MPESKNKTETQPGNTADLDATKRHKPAPLNRPDPAPAAKVTQPPKPSPSAGSKLPAPPPMLGSKPAPSASKASEAKPLPAKPEAAKPIEVRALESSPGSYELKQGIELGEYSLIEPIARGAMGEVWKARNTKIGKWAAIKVPSHEIAARKDAADRFLQEARAVNEIRHRNIVDIFDFGDLVDGRPYYVMELLEGMPLSKYLTSRGPLAFQEIIDIFGATCQALQAAHDHHIIHRDLKSDNIFLVLDKKGIPFVKVLDFGIAKLHGILHDQKDATLPGAIYGTPAYMSPEQCQGAKDVDQAADIYSLGVILYEMLTGRRPFIEDSGNTGMLLVKHITTKPHPPSEMVRGRKISKEVDELVLRALAKERRDRPRSCDAFYEELVLAAGALRFEEKEAITDASPILDREPTVPGTTPNVDQESPTDVGPILTAPPTTPKASPSQPSKPAPPRASPSQEMKPAAPSNPPKASPSQTNKAPAAKPPTPQASPSKEVNTEAKPPTQAAPPEPPAPEATKTSNENAIPEHIAVADDLKPLVISMPTPPKPPMEDDISENSMPSEQGFIPTNVISLRPPKKSPPFALIGGAAAIALALGVFLLWPSNTPEPKTLAPLTPVATPTTATNQEPASEPATAPALATSTSAPAPAAETAPSIPQISFVLDSSPSEADVFLDGTLLGETPLDIKVPFSEIEAALKISKEGYDTVELKFTPNFQYKNQVSLTKTKPAKNNPPKETKTSKTNKTNKTDKKNTTGDLPPNPFAKPKK